MSEQNKPTPQQNDEVDLIQVFHYFEHVFERIGNFILRFLSLCLKIVKKALIFVLFSVSILKKNIISVGIATLLGFGIYFALRLTYKQQYQSNMIIQQNFMTGQVVYNEIFALDKLAQVKDSIALARTLGITKEKAGKIKSFYISHNVDKNDLMKEYFVFLKETDSTNKIGFDQYVLQKNLEESSIQTISVNSTDPSSFEGLSNAILSLILKNPYLKKLQSRDLDILERQKVLLGNFVEDTDSLQFNYFDLLKNYYGLSEELGTSPNSRINLSLDNNQNKDKVETKEYDLYLESLDLRNQILFVENEIQRKSDILVLRKDFSEATPVDNPYNGLLKYFVLGFPLIIMLYYLIRELGFGKVLNKYGNAESLFSKD